LGRKRSKTEGKKNDGPARTIKDASLETENTLIGAIGEGVLPPNENKKRVLTRHDFKDGRARRRKRKNAPAWPIGRVKDGLRQTPIVRDSRGWKRVRYASSWGKTLKEERKRKGDPVACVRSGCETLAVGRVEPARIGGGCIGAPASRKGGRVGLRREHRSFRFSGRKGYFNASRGKSKKMIDSHRKKVKVRGVSSRVSGKKMKEGEK